MSLLAITSRREDQMFKLLGVVLPPAQNAVKSLANTSALSNLMYVGDGMKLPTRTNVPGVKLREYKASSRKFKLHQSKRTPLRLC